MSDIPAAQARFYPLFRAVRGGEANTPEIGGADMPIIGLNEVDMCHPLCAFSKYCYRDIVKVR